MTPTYFAQANALTAKQLFAWGLWILAAEAFPLVLLIVCWKDGDVRVRTKIVFTLLYLGHFGLLFIPNAGFLYNVSKPVLIAVYGCTAFGLDWLTSSGPPGRGKRL
jgi:hypothetical protein